MFRRCGCKIGAERKYRMGSIQLAVFDLAGTTVADNQDVQRVLQQTLLKQDVNITMGEAARVMGIPKPVALRQLLHKHLADKEAVTDEMIEELHDLFVDDMVAFYRTDHLVREMPGASEVFRKLRDAGIKVFVDTGFDRQITDALLARLGWAASRLIDGSITSDEVEHGRPFPDMIYRAMELAGVEEAAAVAKIGDTASDLLEGTAAGCGLTIGVTTGAYQRSELATEPHTHIVDSLEEAVQIILKQ